MSTENLIPDMIGGGNYTLALHARVVQNLARVEEELKAARRLLKDAEDTAIATRVFNPQYERPTPPQTVVMGDTALTIAFTGGRGGGWTYTPSEVAA